MNDINRRMLIREYKETPRPTGVYRVHNTVRKKTFIGSSTNLPGILNRHRFQLENGSHRDHDLQRDWKELGPEAFEFEVLDVLTPKKDLDYDPTEDLAVLLEMRTENIVASGESLYGPTKQRVQNPRH